MNKRHLLLLLLLCLSSKIVAQNQSTNKLSIAAKAIQEKHITQDISKEQLETAAIEGMIDSLADPYSHYLSTNRVKRMRARRKNTSLGIGAKLGIRNGKLSIISCYPNSPAAIAGLKSLDHITLINNYDTKKLSLEEAYSYLNGKKGTSVSLVIRRTTAFKPLEFKIKRNRFHIQSVEESVVFYDTIGYLKFISFEKENAAIEFQQNLEALLQENIKGLIIDLRNNGGGQLKHAERIASFFIKEGPIFQIKDKKKRIKTKYASGDAFCTKIPLFILVNGGTASSAEILASALQENRAATIIGTKTFGKASIQRLFNFKDGSALILTISRYLSSKGKEIQKKGVHIDSQKPIPDDIKAQMESPHYIYSLENDYQLQEAVDNALLKTRHNN